MFTTKTMNNLYVKWEKHHHNMKQWSELLILTTFSMT